MVDKINKIKECVEANARGFSPMNVAAAMDMISLFGKINLPLGGIEPPSNP